LDDRPRGPKQEGQRKHLILTGWMRERQETRLGLVALFVSDVQIKRQWEQAICQQKR
jgi:hypothetical protein